MVETRLDSVAPLNAENYASSLSFSTEASQLFRPTNMAADLSLKSDEPLSFDAIPGYDVKVAALPPPDTSLELEPPIKGDPSQEQPAERAPEDQLEEILTNLPTDASPEDYAQAEKEVTDLLLEQKQTIADAREAYTTYEGIEDLLPESQEEYESAHYAVRPELQKDSTFVNNLANLPYLLYSGQTDKAQLLMHGLLSAAGDQGKEELQSYFDKLKSVAGDNPEIVNEYTGLRNSYVDELVTEQKMLDLLQKHPLNDYIFNK